MTTVSSACGAEAALAGGVVAVCAWTAATPVSSATDEAHATGVNRTERDSLRSLEL
jgi:hypothetical protein